jgi:hypothetical protein
MQAVVTLFVMGSRRRYVPALLASLTMLGGALAAGAAARVPLRFAVAVTGSGHWATTYRSTPPNQGGAPDHNRAVDASTQRWAVRFSAPLVVPACGAARSGDPCRHVRGLSGATGTNQSAGTINHVHIDGLFSQLNATERCAVRSAGIAGRVVPAALSVSYVPRTQRFVLTLRDPDANALLFMPSACPNQGDSIDGLYDNYFMPGFSFASGWGFERWYTSAPVSVKVATLTHRRQIVLRFGPTHRNAPPAGCAVAHRAWEHCRTGGAWSAVVTLRRP